MAWFGSLPLEAVFLNVTVVSVVVGFFMLRWHGLMGGDVSFAVGSFLYVLARASFVACLFVILWRQVLRIDVSTDTWQSLAYLICLVIALGIMTLSGALMLAAVVFADKFGSKGQMPKP